jgi:hypothetical protein
MMKTENHNETLATGRLQLEPVEQLGFFSAHSNICHKEIDIVYTSNTFKEASTRLLPRVRSAAAERH